ncbi:hypothetical protein DSC45_34550 [Streptomyces sp. YIM 130001]|uniref:hypothetical protein n=1 Tax=Streptomyces sp. YIM 130001 TaxID=2259644 RepID=UPI000ECACE20|nr:hypothetical protein [Streptomyces sp. YIM 130001]RII06950.1 hypothetical protein DSC45_34550 [Streptomyces sp. YIM 130001]
MTDTAGSPASVGLGADEVVLVRARRRLRTLVVALEMAPFAETTRQAMQTYLEEDAAAAHAAFVRWSDLPRGVRDRRARLLREALS